MSSRKNMLKRVWDFIWNSDSAASWAVDLILAFILVRFIIFPVLGFLLVTSLPLVVIESGSMEHETIKFCADSEMGECLEYKHKICGFIFNEKQKFNVDGYWNLCGQWYKDKNISKEQFSGWDFNNGLDKGDIIITRGKEEYEVGDIVIFRTSIQSTPIIHRIINYDPNFYNFETKGDNNPTQLLYEKQIKQEDIFSEALIRIPKVGWVKLSVVEFIRYLSN